MKKSSWYNSKCHVMTMLVYSDKRKQVMKVTFLVNEQSLSSFTLMSIQYHDILT